MSVEGKEDALFGKTSFTWKSGCTRSRSHCKREVVDFPDKAFCPLHNMNSDIAAEVLRGGPVYLFEQRSCTIGTRGVLVVTRDLVIDFRVSLDLCTYSCCH